MKTMRTFDKYFLLVLDGTVSILLTLYVFIKIYDSQAPAEEIKATVSNIYVIKHRGRERGAGLNVKALDGVIYFYRVPEEVTQYLKNGDRVITRHTPILKNWTFIKNLNGKGVFTSHKNTGFWVILLGATLMPLVFAKKWHNLEWGRILSWSSSIKWLIALFLLVA